jgi:hypothetical protein
MVRLDYRSVAAYLLPLPAASIAVLIFVASRAFPSIFTRPLSGNSTSTPGRFLAMLALIAAPQPNFQVMPSTLKLTAVSSALFSPWVVELVELPAASDFSPLPAAGEAGSESAAGAGSDAGAVLGSLQPELISAADAINATAKKLRVFIMISN